MSAASDPAKLFRLDSKVAVVTGGSRGLGREMVLAFARSGADVVIASRKEEACALLAKEVENETGQRALAVGTHVGRWEDNDALAKRALDHFGKVDILVNNAGMSPVYDKVGSITEALYDKVMDVNLKGPFRLSCALADSMLEGDGGSIVFVSSIAAVQASPGEVPYGAAKAGLHSLTRSLARTWAPKIRVNCIMPGAFMTDISKAWPQAMIDALERVIPLQRGGQPDEVVGAALYLTSGASAYTTGSVVKVDGGAAFDMG